MEFFELLPIWDKLTDDQRRRVAEALNLCAPIAAEIFLLTSDKACAKLSLLQYLSFALAKHSLQVSQRYCYAQMTLQRR